MPCLRMDRPRHIVPRSPAANHAIASPPSLSRPLTALSNERPATRLSVVVRASLVSVEYTSGIDDDGLTGHGLATAHGDHHIGAIVLVGGLLEERSGRGALDLLGTQIGCRARPLQQSRRHAVDERRR